MSQAGVSGARAETLAQRGAALAGGARRHRLAVLRAVAGLASRDGVEVVGMEAAAASCPGFEVDLAALRRP